MTDTPKTLREPLAPFNDIADARVAAAYLDAERKPRTGSVFTLSHVHRTTPKPPSTG